MIENEKWKEGRSLERRQKCEKGFLHFPKLPHKNRATRYQTETKQKHMDNILNKIGWQATPKNLQIQGSKASPREHC